MSSSSLDEMDETYDPVWRFSFTSSFSFKERYVLRRFSPNFELNDPSCHSTVIRSFRGSPPHSFDLLASNTCRWQDGDHQQECQLIAPRSFSFLRSNSRGWTSTRFLARTSPFWSSITTHHVTTHGLDSNRSCWTFWGAWWQKQSSRLKSSFRGWIRTFPCFNLSTCIYPACNKAVDPLPTWPAWRFFLIACNANETYLPLCLHLTS